MSKTISIVKCKLDEVDLPEEQIIPYIKNHFLRPEVSITSIYIKGRLVELSIKEKE